MIVARHRHEDINRHIGVQLKARRKGLKISQQAVGSALDVSYQQIQKFEAGKNGLSAAQLQILAHELQVPIEYFLPEARLNGKKTQAAMICNIDQH